MSGLPGAGIQRCHQVLEIQPFGGVGQVMLSHRQDE